MRSISAMIALGLWFWLFFAFNAFALSWFLDTGLALGIILVREHRRLSGMKSK